MSNIKEYKEIDDPVELINKAIEADLDSTVFTEKEFETAPNIISWCTEHRFLNASTAPWPRQIEVMVRFFEDMCYFCSDIDYVHNVRVDDSLDECLDHFELLHHGICPKCKRNRLEILDEWIKDPKYAKFHNWNSDVRLRPVPPNEFTGIWGQRSGKSFTTASFIFTYILHRYLVLPSIPRYFQMPMNTVLEAAFIAPTKDQVKTYMWQPFLNAYDVSPWFKEMVVYLKEEGKKLGIPAYNRQTTAVTFPYKRLIVQMKAASSTNLRGGTRIWASIDELGWFNVADGTHKKTLIKDGTEVFTALNRSLRTVRSKANKRRRTMGDYNALDGYMCCISSPSSVLDPIEQRAAVAAKSPRMFYTRYATWEVNPNEDEETIVEEEGADVVKLKRDYYAQPPRSSAPFVEPTNNLKQLIFENDKKLFNYKIKVVQDPESGIQLLRPILELRAADKVTPRAITVDNGETKNSFSLCVSRFYPEQSGILLEEFIEVSPHQGHHVDMQWVYDELVVRLVTAYNIIHVIYDRWESAYAIRDLRNNHRINALRHSLQWQDFVKFKYAIEDSRLYFPKPEIDPDELLTINSHKRAKYPRANFQVQMTTVNKFNRKVTKPDNGEDDLFRCGVLAHWVISNNIKEYQFAKPKKRQRRVGGFFSARRFSGARNRRRY